MRHTVIAVALLTIGLPVAGCSERRAPTAQPVDLNAAADRARDTIDSYAARNRRPAPTRKAAPDRAPGRAMAMAAADPVTIR
ncbi:hypothetical protein [uncultured Sphingomonas sp.]|uniref:hypothetical protein n=1 Tax=uncultured Sphingomonas sp. TaxID=158754 RepID=UPI0035CC7E13